MKNKAPARLSFLLSALDALHACKHYGAKPDLGTSRLSSRLSVVEKIIYEYRHVAAGLYPILQMEGCTSIVSAGRIVKFKEVPLVQNSVLNQLQVTLDVYNWLKFGSGHDLSPEYSNLLHVHAFLNAVRVVTMRNWSDIKYIPHGGANMSALTTDHGLPEDITLWVMGGLPNMMLEPNSPRGATDTTALTRNHLQALCQLHDIPTTLSSPSIVLMQDINRWMKSTIHIHADL